ncbi:hypothetical protein PInf_010400 [Phytophthora infestans]|nr:hypothetical protein PInf_010400 [Phytophthora infestans]
MAKIHRTTRLPRPKLMRNRWRVTVHDTEYIYSPTSTSDSMDVAIPAFQRWIEELTVKVPFGVMVRAGSWDGTAISGAATFDVKLYGGFDSITGRYTMLAPALIPVFEVVGGTESGGVDNIQHAGATYSMWDVKLWSSIGQTPKAPYTPTAWDLLAGEFFCLSYGSCDMEYSDVYVDNTLDHVPMNLELVRSSVNVELRTFASTEWDVQINDAPFSYKPNAAVATSIEDSSLQFQKWLQVLDSDDSVKLEIQVADRVVDSETKTAKLSLRLFGSFDDDFYQGWDLFANELACFATSCDLEYADVVSPFLDLHIPTSLNIAEQKGIVSLRTYADTTWNMRLNNEWLSYSPDSSDPMTIYDAAAALYDWIEAQLTQSPYDLVVERDQPKIDSGSGAATMRMGFHGLPAAYGELVAPPWLIPRFEATGGTTGGGDTGLPVAEDNVTPWEIALWVQHIYNSAEQVHEMR